MRTAQTLLKVNQDGGFDARVRLARPAHRSAFEFCENGAKVAEEATRKRVGPEFFARYLVEELRSRWTTPSVARGD